MVRLSISSMYFLGFMSQALEDWTRLWSKAAPPGAAFGPPSNDAAPVNGLFMLGHAYAAIVGFRTTGANKLDQQPGKEGSL